MFSAVCAKTPSSEAGVAGAVLCRRRRAQAWRALAADAPAAGAFAPGGRIAQRRGGGAVGLSPDGGTALPAGAVPTVKVFVPGTSSGALSSRAQQVRHDRAAQARRRDALVLRPRRVVRVGDLRDDLVQFETAVGHIEAAFDDRRQQRPRDRHVRVQVEHAVLVVEHAEVPARHLQVHRARLLAAQAQLALHRQQVTVVGLDAEFRDEDALLLEGQHGVHVLVGHARHRDDERAVGEEHRPFHVRIAAGPGDAHVHLRLPAQFGDVLGDPFGQRKVDGRRDDGDVETIGGSGGHVLVGPALEQRPRQHTLRGQPRVAGP